MRDKETGLTGKALFHAIMNFEKPDRVPLWDLEGFTEGAIRTWCTQGMPIGANVYDLFKFDGKLLLPIDANPIPSFVERTLSEDDEWRTYIDRYGFTVKVSKKQSVSPRAYYYLRGSIETRADWQKMKTRYQARDPRRYPKSWSPELVEHYRTVECPIGIMVHWGPGRGVKNGYMLGLERFLDVIVAEPALIEDMFSFWADFLIELLGEWVSRLAVDFVFLNEDGLAYKNSSLISPAMYRRLWKPHVARVSEFLRSHGVKVVGHYTSGNIEPLIPAFLESGLNLFAPLERAADMDAARLRKEYGQDILLMGNIGRAALMAGKEAIDREISSKIPRLMEHGGYIPALDDMVLPDISYDNFRYFVDAVRRLSVG